MYGMESLEITNFKSFKGKHVIGPLKRFTAVIGPNGSGKSNLMDAISFVLGERGARLRVRKLGDLIHGASIGKPVPGGCEVQMNFRDASGNHRSFKRAILSSTASEYRIDGSVVTAEAYHHALQDINIYIKAHNFLVYQGAVEQVAIQSPKELTAMFEELSRSSEYKADYERLKAEMQKAETDAQEHMNKRRDVALEKKEAKAEKDQASNYQAIRDDLAVKNRDLYLAQIYAAEKGREKAQRQLEDFQQQVDEVKLRKAEFDEQLTEKNRLVRERFREANRLESKILKEEKRVSNQKPVCAQHRQVVEHHRAKIEGTRKAHQAAKRKAEELERNIKEAEKKLSAAKTQRVELERQLVQESQQLQLNLNPEQIAEYRRLKNDAEKQTTFVATHLYNLTQDQDTDRGIVQHEKRRLEQWNAKIKEKTEEIEREKRNVEALKEEETRTRQRIDQEKKELREFEQQITTFKEESTTLNNELNEIMKQINDANGEINETRREQNRREALENLKRVFPEKVLGRLDDLCTPSHTKYSIAVTKILQKHMTSIVCDTDETARQCIPYLREQRHGPETFLPLNALEVKPIKESLRAISNPPGVKLIYDVIQCNLPQARKALQFACGNALVADTADQARQLAYGTDRHRTVALDGTLFQPNGTISGGGSDLKARAKKWDEQVIRKLKERKSVLVDKLHKLQANSKRELDVEMKRRQIHSLEGRFRCIQIEMKNKQEHVRQLETQLEVMQSELNNIQPRIDDKEQAIRQREKEIQALDEERSRVEDRIFQEFCQRIGIRHIREYEERELRFHEESQRKLVDYDTRIQHLENELDFLRAEDRAAIVRRESEALKSLEDDLKTAERSLETENAKLAELQEGVDQMRAELEQKKAATDEAETQLSALRKDGQAIDKQLKLLGKKIEQQEQAIRLKSHERHEFLHECKANGIQLPLLRGALDRLNIIDKSLVSDSLQQAQSSQMVASSSQLNSDSLETAEDIQVDFRALNTKTKRALEDDSKAAALIEEFRKAATDAETKFSKLQPPSSDVNERMEQVKEREKENNEASEESRKKARKARQDFDKVKNLRLTRFQEFFEPVSQRIDEVYKRLSQNPSAQAYLGPVNAEEPYLDGINYNCIAPGKRFQPMDNLSGGEKTIAALALLFAINASNPSPFFVLDEIDAALDNTNIGKVLKYVSERSREGLQFIVISLKEELFNSADALIGVYPERIEPCMGSAILSLDLENFAIE